MATETKRVYDIQVNGTDSVNDLRNAIEQLNDKLKALNETSKEYKDTLAQLTDYQSKLADAMKGISDTAQTTNESLDDLKDIVDGVASAFTEGLAQGIAEAAKETLEFGESMDTSVNSVKDLKQHISDLRDRLVTLDSGSDAYKATVQELIDAQVKLKEVMNAGKNEMQAAEGSYNALSQRMSALKQVWKEATDEATRDEIGRQIAEINAQLKGMDASIGNFQRNVGNYQSALDGLDGSFVKWKQELRECKEAMEQLDPSSQAYADAMARAAEITHQLSDQQEMIKYSSTDLGDQLNNVRGIASNMAAGFSAVNAAMGLFGEENEEVQQAMLKVQQAMALVQGLQGIDGFIKRTKGLSQSMGLVTKATQANTVATQANATASKADAVAKGAETVATKAAVPAQLSLNAAMEANPIGFIIGLIAALVTAFVLLKDKIMEMIGANEEMSSAFEKIKAVLAGFGNVIKKSVINPIKMSLIPIKTFAKVMVDLFKGDWTKIGEDIKNGFIEMKDTAIDSINVIGSFKEGYDKKRAEQEEAARKKEAEARTKELNDIIKDNEAKYGNDWKYTKDAQKLYQQMFDAREAMYDKDSDEYKENVRERMAYDREYGEHQAELAKSAAQAELEYKKALYGDDYEWSDEWHQKVLEGLEDAQAAYDKALKDYNDAREHMLNSLEPIKDELKEKGWDIYDQDFEFGFVLDGVDYGKLLKDAKDFLSQTELEVKKYERRLDDYNTAQAQKRIAAYKSLLSDIRSNFEKFVPDVMREQWNFDDIIDKWEDSIDTYKGYLKSVRKLTDEEIDDVIKEITDKINKANYDAMVAASLSTMEKDFTNLDRVVRQTMANVKAEFDLKEVINGITIPDEAIANIENMFSMARNAAMKELVDVEGEIDRMYNMLAGKDADGKEGPYYGMTIEQLGQTLPTFQKFLDKKNELEAKVNQLELDRFRKVSDVYKQDWENRLTIVKEGNQAINDITEQNFNEQINNAIRWQGVYGNALMDLYEDKDYYTEIYKEQKGQLEMLQQMYIEMANDERLTFEEKENAKREAAKLTAELIQLEYEKELNMLKTQKGLWKEWVNAVKDAASGVGDILSNLSNYYTGLMELEQAKIDKQLEDKKITDEQAEALYAQQKSNFEKSKNLQLAMTWINGFSAAIGAYQSMASIPYVGPVLGAAAAAAALATTAIQAQKIKATDMDNPYGGSGGGSSSSTSFQLPNVMELEPELSKNMTGISDTDSLNNGGNGKGETAIRAYVVESEIGAAQKVANKRTQEVTF